MAKLTLTDIASAYQSTAQINNNFAAIEEAFENTLSRDGSSPNQMNANLDLNGFAILNGSFINIANDAGVSIADGVSYAQEWAQKAEDSLVSAAAGGDLVDDYSSLHHAAKASASATAAASSASAASTSETNAATSETNAAASYDSFDDRYLGAKGSAPALDNDGDALITGAMYFNTASNDMWIYNGAAWGLIGTTQNSAASVTIADAGGYFTGANVETALQEVGADLAVSGSFSKDTAKALTGASTSLFNTVPSWARKITGFVTGASGSGGGAVNLAVRLGDSGGIESTGYRNGHSIIASPLTIWFYLGGGAGGWVSDIADCTFVLTSDDGITWNCSTNGNSIDSGGTNMQVFTAHGSKTLSGALTQIQLLNDGANFDAGSWNLIYEG